jgi:hypothetical protein
MAGRRRTFDAQQQEIPPKRRGSFYRQPGDTSKLGGKFYSQQTEPPDKNPGNFYTRQPSTSKVPEGHFYRDRSEAASPPNLDEEGQGPKGEMNNAGVDREGEAEVRALREKLSRRSKKVHRQRGQL